MKPSTISEPARRLLAFASDGPKITGNPREPLLAELLAAGLMEAAPYEKDGLFGAGWQITAAGRIELLRLAP